MHRKLPGTGLLAWANEGEVAEQAKLIILTVCLCVCVRVMDVLFCYPYISKRFKVVLCACVQMKKMVS